MQTRYDAVIVGGGHNGLVAASYLARAGQSVLLLERNPELGGATASEAIFPGMDARVSRYSYLVSLLPEAIVRELELPFTCRRREIASCTPYRRDGADRALLLSNVDAEHSRDSFCELTTEADLRGFERLMALESVFADRVWPSLLEPLRSREEWVSSLQTADEREAWESFVERPLGETIERLVQDDVVRGLLFTDGKIGIFTHPHDPSLQQNRCFILHTVGNTTGEWLVPVGGMGSLVAALAGTARAAGAELLTDTEVTAVSTGAPHHTVRYRQGDAEQEVEATRVLINAGPQVFARLLDEEYVPSPEDEGSVCKVNMLLRKLPRLRASEVDPRDAFAGTFHVDETYRQMEASYREAAGGSIPERPPYELYCHTLTDESILGPELRGEGYQTLTLFGLDAPYRLFERDNAAVKQELLQRYLAGLNRLLAEPIEDCLAVDAEGKPCIEIKSPPDLERSIALNRGNIFHGALSWFFAERDDEAGTWGVETRHERVYRCGASAVRGGAVSGIPGRNAARCILEEIA